MKTPQTITLILTFLICGFLVQSAMAKNGDIEICGTIESVDSSQVTLNGISYALNSDTEYEDASGNEILVNDFVVDELIQLRIREGQVDQLEKENEANCSSSNSPGDDNGDDNSSGDHGNKKTEQKICGAITAITTSTVTVASQKLIVLSSTQLESKSGTTLTLDAFHVGDFVKAKVENGDLHELEIDSASGCKSQKAAKKDAKFQDGQSSNSRDSSRRRQLLKTKLIPSDGVTTDGRGKSVYLSKAKKGKTRTIFKIQVKIPVPSTTPSVGSSDAAASLQLLAILQRGTETIATCVLEFDEVDNGKAEYKIDLRERNNSFRAKKGSCDVDLAQSGTQDGIPSLRKGDDISVVPSTLDAFLEGQF